MSRVTTAGAALAGFAAINAALNARLLRQPPTGAAGPDRSVAILVPARNEAASIETCLESLRGQGEVIVLDDESRDGTGALARAAGVRVVDGVAPPADWLGKPWACAQLAAATDAEILVFVDADVRLAPGAVGAAVAMLESAGLDVVCPFPRQLAVTPGERLVQPLLQWSWLATLPLRVAERSRRPSLTAACGQFLVVRRAALDRAGGYAAVRDAVLDDLALVRAIKAAGGRGGVVDGTELAACRMYDSWPALRDGYRKSLWAAFGSRRGAVAIIGVLALAYVVPPVAALRGSRVGVLGYAAGVLSRLIAAHRTGGRGWPDALAHPASVVALAYLTAESWRGKSRGDLRWKDRPIG